MAITRTEKAIYNEHIKEIKAEEALSIKRISELEKKKRAMPGIKEYYTIEIILELLKIIQLNINMSESSMEILNIKNEASLKNARKEFHNVLQRLESIVGDEIDRSLKDNEEYLIHIDKVNPVQVLTFIKRINYVLATLIESIGESSKWKWSFVDLYVRVAVITKNIINFTEIYKSRDPRKEFYKERQELLLLCKQSLKEAARQLRGKYEQSTKVPSDMLKAIDLLSVLRKIHVLFSESDEAVKIKTTIDALRARLEAEEKEKEKRGLKK